MTRKLETLKAEIVPICPQCRHPLIDPLTPGVKNPPQIVKHECYHDGDSYNVAIPYSFIRFSDDEKEQIAGELKTGEPKDDGNEIPG